MSELIIPATHSVGDAAAPPSPELLAQLPEALRQAVEEETSFIEAAAPALLPYPRLPDATFQTQQVKGKILAYASPDSTYAVTKKLLASARQSLIIGIYDFHASYIKDELKQAMRRGVRVSLMLDTDSAEELALLAELAGLGADCTKAPSASAGNAWAYFGNAHEKIIVVDRQLVMVQSGNWSENSIPFNEHDGEAGTHFVMGNRDMGLAIESEELANLFAELVLRDMRLARGQEPTGGAAAPAAPALPATEEQASELFFEAAPAAVPVRLFHSLTLTPTTSVAITPVVTPENFYPALEALLRGAKRSVRIEQQYIRGGQEAVVRLLEALKAARAENPGLVIQIIVSPKYLYGKAKDDFLQVMAAYNLPFGEGYRYLAPQHFVHCHNKLIVVDEQRVLLGSQNWSTTGLLTNREASLLVDNPEIAAYFASIFDADWRMSAPVAGAPPAAQLAADVQGLVEATAFARGGVVISSLSDYRAV
jgi:phosphatidylserine/phosphatidylglycerophosphate/cardiolipin synthase-like enzyme